MRTSNFVGPMATSPEERFTKLGLNLSQSKQFLNPSWIDLVVTDQNIIVDSRPSLD